MNLLDQIEKKIQSFIEDNPLFSGWLDPKIRLARLLTEAMQQDLDTLPDGTIIVPDKYYMRLSSGDYDYWLGHLDALDDLSYYLQSISAETGVHLRNTPTITLIEDPRMADGQYEISTDNLSEKTFNTTTIATGQPEPRQESSLPLNAYLLYDFDQVFLLDKPMISIGRRADNDLVIDDPRVSRAHIQLRVMNGSFIVFDLNSTGGTYVNDRPVNQKTLIPGDVISLAGVPLIYVEDQSPLGSDTTQTKKVGGERKHEEKS